MKLEQLEKNIICIDTEYHCNKDNGKIDKVYCVAACTADNRTFKKWTENEPISLYTIAKHFNIKHPIFCCHALAIAERKAFKFMGDNPDSYRWLDTYTIAKVLGNLAFKIKLSYSLAETIELYTKYDIDTDHKDAMRELCINDTIKTDEDKDNILNYCLSDVTYLWHVVKSMYNYYELGKGKYTIVGKPCELKDTIDRFLHWTEQVVALAKVSDYGIPINVERLDKLKRVANIQINKMHNDFSLKYPNTFKTDKKGVVHECLLEVQKRICEDVEKFNVSDDEMIKTSTGKYSATKEGLAVFRGSGCFSDEYRHLKEITSQLNGIVGEKRDTKTGDLRSWTKTLDRDKSILDYGDLNAFGSQTGRCQPKPSNGFCFLWSKTFYGILEPPEGYWLVECDYHSQETGIQAITAKDKEYTKFYTAKDCYWYMASLLNLIDSNDYDTLTSEELKLKYGNDIRQTVKKFTLAKQYGAKPTKLSVVTGLDKNIIERWCDTIDNKIFKQTTKWKDAVLSNVGWTHYAPTVYGIELHDGTRLRTIDSMFCGTDYLKDVYADVLQGAEAKSNLSVLNFPIQGQGGLILRELAIYLTELENIIPIATVHDAFVFMVKEGDLGAIRLVKNMMVTVAAKLLNDTKHKTITVGEPEIIKHGEPWCPDSEHYKQWCDLMGLEDEKEI